MEPFHADELTLTEGPRERGRIHGERMCPQITRNLTEFSDAVRANTGADAKAVYNRIVHGAGFLRAAETWTPSLVEEVRGIAEGSGLPFETMMAWQLIQEMSWFPQKEGLVAPVATACTSLGSCPS